MGHVTVVGAGAAGLVAAGFAARAGHAVTLIERNPRPGRKLMITGKGRCNVTNDCDVRDFMQNVPRNGRFLFSALNAFGPAQTMAFFEGLGVPLKVERGRRVFPVSDRAVDIVDALGRFVRDAGCRMREGRAEELIIRDGAAAGVRLEGGGTVTADAVILCTGGLSYPATGSTGDGYALARAAGHTVVKPVPSLVPLVTEEDWPAQLQGLSLRNVTLSVTEKEGTRPVFEELGEMMFTHFGVTGPLVLSASTHMRPMEPGRYVLHIDLKPALAPEQLDMRLQCDFLKYSGCDFINSLHDLLPAKLIPVFAQLTGIDPHQRVGQLTREMRQAVGSLLKDMRLTIRAFRPIEEAVITSGGVDCREVSPRTMESRRVANLYFAGELLDVDAYTGGYNLQIAFSTGFAAGNGVLAWESGMSH